MENILEIKNLSKSYKDFTLNNISFNLPKGYIMGFIGENGAGKTTTIKAIMTLVRNTTGEIKVFGLDNMKNEMEVKSRIGYVYDDGYFYETLSLEDNAKLLMKSYPKWNDTTFNKYLAKFKLDKTQKFTKLSKGMKMKFSLACALSHEAELIILDEPTSGLDPVVRAEVLSILQASIEDGNHSVLISTHITEDLEKIADFITYIRRGNMVFSMPKDDVFEKYKLVKGSTSFLDNETKKLFLGIRKNSSNFEAITDKFDEIQSLYPKERLVYERPTLEQIMVLLSKQ